MMVAEAKPNEVEISHPDVEEHGYVLEESLQVWLRLGWTVVEDEESESESTEDVPKFVVQVDEDGNETMVEQSADEPVEETPLPDEKESGQDDTADPKE